MSSSWHEIRSLGGAGSIGQRRDVNNDALAVPGNYMPNPSDIRTLQISGHFRRVYARGTYAESRERARDRAISSRSLINRDRPPIFRVQADRLTASVRNADSAPDSLREIATILADYFPAHRGQGFRVL